MLQFIGYDFFSGKDALNSAPCNTDNLSEVKLTNAIFDHFNLTGDVSKYGDNTIPSDWTYETILDANFNGNINAGNIEYIIGQINGVKIKRRVKGTFDWITLKYIPVENVQGLNFAFNDYLNAYGVNYEYALVPIFGDVEGDYIISEIMSKFSGVFIGDSEQAFRMMYDVNYSGNARKQQTGTFTPLGKKYPIIVANGVLSYEVGSVSADILNDEFDENGKIDRAKIVNKKKVIKDYLTDKKPKILKDWNGNIWLVLITSDVGVEYRQGSGMGIPHVNFEWAEIGDANNQKSLYDAGLVEDIE